MKPSSRFAESIRALALSTAVALAACDPTAFEGSVEGADAGASDTTPTPMSNADAGTGRGGEPMGARDGSAVPMPAADAALSIDTGLTTAADAADANAPEAAASDTTPAPDASSDAQLLMCVNTASDPDNCGRCGNSCSAKGALVSCANSACIRTCMSPWDDCNKDLQHGANGDGCEKRVDNDVDNCGGCGKRCEQPEHGFSTCDDLRCNGHTLRVEGIVMSATHGNPVGGGAYTMVCPEGEVITAVQGLGRGGSVCSLGVQCSRLHLRRSGSKVAASTVPTSVLGSYGGSCDGEALPYSLVCPKDMVATGIAGSIWQFGGTANTAVVRRISLTCSSISVSPDMRVSLSPGPTYSYGVDEAMPVAVFDVPCGPNQLIAGFSGRYGAYFDAIAAHCGTLRTNQKPTKPVAAQADAVISSAVSQ